MQDDVMTCKGLSKWYSKEFEKAGWVILAVSKGHDFKAMMYRHGVKHLLKALELKRTTVTSVDKRSELDIMIRNTQILLQWIDSSFSEAIQRAMIEKEQYGMSPRSYTLPQQGSVVQSFTRPFTGVGSLPLGL
jgi:hypothetical protein